MHRIILELTERGHAAAEASWEATDRIDRELEQAVGAEAARQMRDGRGPGRAALQLGESLKKRSR
jgi:DNA-binding MarR family transcriptional regulator